MKALSVPALLGLSLLMTLSACSSESSDSESDQPDQGEQSYEINPENWPELQGFSVDEDIESRIDELMAGMSVEHKVAQVIQPDIASITPEEFRKYQFGSVLNGGNSAPGNNQRAQPSEWLALADEYWEASTADGGIPYIWGTDAVHGHSNIYGATIFPHNIGLGATRNPDLIKRIGAATAIEVLVTGMDWTFAPTVAVVRDDRWGRTYEGYSEDPEITSQFAPAMVEGIQGKMGSEEFLGDGKMLACTKHFVGDGGTFEGIDQGDNRSTEAELRDIHAAGYPPALDAGALNVMASFNSWHGKKMHGNESMLTGVLKEQMNFQGFVVGDWNGHGQIEGMSNTSSPQALLAGLDMYMAPDSWKGLYDTTLMQVSDGTIPMKNLDEAVRRILRVKILMGVFEKPKPSERTYAGQFNLLGNQDHLDIARQAVRESLVLIKNNNQTLPADPGQKVLVCGNAADNIGQQCGGWTLSWQGTGNLNEHFPNGYSIWNGIEEKVNAAGGSAELSASGDYTEKPDLAIVVFGETPYAEFMGDVKHLDFVDNEGLELLRKFQAEGIPTVSLFISGRPMWVNPELNASDAFVAVWLPGTQGGAMADVLFNSARDPQFDFKGKLSYSWPMSAVQTAVNRGDENYTPLFAYGYGLNMGDQEILAELSEELELPESSELKDLFVDGKAADVLQFMAMSGDDEVSISDNRNSIENRLLVQSIDHLAQEDAKRITWTEAGMVEMRTSSADLERQSNGDLALSFFWRKEGDISGDLMVYLKDHSGQIGSISLNEHLQANSGAGWHQTDIKLSCFASQGLDMAELDVVFGLKSTGPADISIAQVKLVPNEGEASCLD
jgi:beta-glucosidase